MSGGKRFGHLVDDLTLDRVFIWEVEELKKRFTSSKTVNVMQNKADPNSNPYFFPTLSKDTTETDTTKKGVKTTNYNKL